MLSVRLSRLCKYPSSFYSLKEWLANISSTSAAALENNGNKLNGSCNETKYTFFFLYPVIKHLLYSAPFNFKLGESHLQCAIKTTDDDEAADAGPKIDIIMSHKENGLALSVVEVSGPNYKTNKNHFVGDRNKITKNLKAILRQIQKTCSAPDIVAFKKIKVYGLQVYKNKLYIYSLSQISFSYYLFILEKTIEIPSSPGLLYQQLPGFLASISYLVNIYEDMNANIMKFFDDSNTHAMPIYSNSEASTPNVSPKKQKLSRSSAQWFCLDLLDDIVKIFACLLSFLSYDLVSLGLSGYIFYYAAPGFPSFCIILIKSLPIILFDCLCIPVFLVILAFLMPPNH